MGDCKGVFLFQSSLVALNEHAAFDSHIYSGLKHDAGKQSKREKYINYIIYILKNAQQYYLH